MLMKTAVNSSAIGFFSANAGMASSVSAASAATVIRLSMI